MKLFEIVRNVAHGQWANCLAFLHVGTRCLVIASPFGGGSDAAPYDRWYGTGIELFTPTRRFRFRLGGRADLRRRRRRANV